MFSANRHDITEILLKVALNTTKQANKLLFSMIGYNRTEFSISKRYYPSYETCCSILALLTDSCTMGCNAHKQLEVTGLQ